MLPRTVSAAVVGSVLVLAACGAPPTAPSDAPNVPRVAPSAVAVDDGSYLVRTNGKGFPANFAAQVEALGGTVTFTHDGAGIGAVAGLSADAAARLAKISGIAGVAMDDYTLVDMPDAAMVEATDLGVASAAQPNTAFFFARQWNMRQIHADAAWAAGRLGQPTTKVGIIDTGLDYTHADLVGRVDLVNSVSFEPSDDARVAANFPGAHPVADLYYHGTHVGATVASNALAAAGVTSGVTLVGIKVCNVFGSCPTSGVLRGILYAADLGLPVANMSLGGSFQKRANNKGGSDPSFVATVNQTFTYAQRKGTLIVVAAGNAAADMDHSSNTFFAYCSAPGVVCVAATGPTAAASVNGPWTDPDASSSYSNFGRSAISVAAPGGNAGIAVYAACSRFSLAIPVCRTGTFVVGSSGTSMATPHVTALAALISEDVGHDPSQIRTRLQQSADDLGQPGTDPYYGKGRINVARALGL